MAKTTKIKRKDLNKPDQFISTTDIILAYCSKHKTRLISIVTTLVLLGCIGLWVKNNQSRKSLKMESLYHRVELIKSANSSKPNVTIEKIESLLSEFNEGPQKQRAIMILADQYYGIQAYDRAIELYKDVLTKTSPMQITY